MPTRRNFIKGIAGLFVAASAAPELITRANELERIHFPHVITSDDPEFDNWTPKSIYALDQTMVPDHIVQAQTYSNLVKDWQVTHNMNREVLNYTDNFGYYGYMQPIVVAQTVHDVEIRIYGVIFKATGYTYETTDNKDVVKLSFNGAITEFDIRSDSYIHPDCLSVLGSYDSKYHEFYVDVSKSHPFSSKLSKIALNNNEMEFQLDGRYTY